MCMARSRFASSINGRFSSSVRSFHSAPEKKNYKLYNTNLCGAEMQISNHFTKQKQEFRNCLLDNSSSLASRRPPFVSLLHFPSIRRDIPSQQSAYSADTCRDKANCDVSLVGLLSQ